MKKFSSFFLLLGFVGASPFSVEVPSTPVQMEAGATQAVQLILHVPDRHYIYKDKTDVEFVTLGDIHVDKIIFPKPKLHSDPFFHKETPIFEGEVPVQILISLPADAKLGPRELQANVSLQGCSDKLCYPLEEHLVSWHVTVGAAATETGSAEAPPSHSIWQLLHENDFSHVLTAGWGWALLIVWIGGILTSLTPCVLPIIPLTLLVIGVKKETPLWRNFLLSLSLVFGIAATYATLGVLAVVFGKSLGFIFQQSGFVWFLVFFFIYLALAMFGWVPLQLPSKWAVRLSQWGGKGFRGAFLAGMGTGLLAAPCVGPVMGPLLLFVAATQKWWTGFWLLFVYALGMGLLFLILGTGYRHLHGKFKSSALSLWIKRILGVALLGVALFYLNTVVPIESTIRHWGAAREEIVWLPTEEAGLALAKLEHKPILIDFYADWCLPCKELANDFFRRPEIVTLLKQMVPVRIDATVDSPTLTALLEKYKVVGWPTILFLDEKGRRIKELDVVGYNVEKLEANMASLRGKNDRSNPVR